MLTALTGFLAGFTHVLSGPDHLAAVTPFSLNLRRKAWLIGFLWGLGHTLGALLIGVIFILFKELVPLDFITRNSESIVGILLILIGLWAFWQVFHHEYLHGTHNTHSHDHIDERNFNRSTLTAFGVGVLHGLAGFSHLVAVLPSLALPGKSASILYLASFGAGTILTMTGFTALLGLLAQRLAQARQKKLLRVATLAGGLLAIGVGIFWLVKPY